MLELEWNHRLCRTLRKRHVLELRIEGREKNKDEGAFFWILSCATWTWSVYFCSSSKATSFSSTSVFEQGQTEVFRVNTARWQTHTVWSTSLRRVRPLLENDSIGWTDGDDREFINAFLQTRKHLMHDVACPFLHHSSRLVYSETVFHPGRRAKSSLRGWTRVYHDVLSSVTRASHANIMVWYWLPFGWLCHQCGLTWTDGDCARRTIVLFSIAIRDAWARWQVDETLWCRAEVISSIFHCSLHFVSDRKSVV